MKELFRRWESSNIWIHHNTSIARGHIQILNQLAQEQPMFSSLAMYMGVECLSGSMRLPPQAILVVVPSSTLRLLPRLAELQMSGCRYWNKSEQEIRLGDHNQGDWCNQVVSEVVQRDLEQYTAYQRHPLVLTPIDSIPLDEHLLKQRRLDGDA